MHQFEIELSTDEATRFDQVFWEFLRASFGEGDQPEVILHSLPMGDRVRRTIAFSNDEMIGSFLNYWQGLVRRARRRAFVL